MWRSSTKLNRFGYSSISFAAYCWSQLSVTSKRKSKMTSQRNMMRNQRPWQLSMARLGTWSKLSTKSAILNYNSLKDSIMKIKKKEFISLNKTSMRLTRTRWVPRSKRNTRRWFMMKRKLPGKKREKNRRSRLKSLRHWLAPSILIYKRIRMTGRIRKDGRISISSLPP